jgi:hypothetical protein
MSSFCSSCEELEEAGALVDEAGALVLEAGALVEEAGAEVVGVEVVFDEAAELVPVEEAVVLPQPAKMRAEEARTSNNAVVLFFIVFPPYF